MKTFIGDASAGTYLTPGRIFYLENRLLALRDRCERVRSTGNGFCANDVWFGHGEYRGIKPDLGRLVGHYAQHPSDVVTSEEAYKIVYDALYDLLPPCGSDCGCM